MRPVPEELENLLFISVFFGGNCYVNNEGQKPPPPVRFAGFVAGQPHFFIYYVILIV